jgi:hypothetical protein
MAKRKSTKRQTTIYKTYRACCSYQDFLDRGLLLTRTLLNQGFLLVKLKSSLRKFYRRHHDLVDCYGIATLYQGNPDRNHKLCNIVSTERCIFCWNVATYRWKVHNGKIEIISFEKKLYRSFSFTFRYIDNVHSLNNSRFGDFVDRIYPIALEIKDISK